MKKISLFVILGIFIGSISTYFILNSKQPIVQKILNSSELEELKSVINKKESELGQLKYTLNNKESELKDLKSAINKLENLIINNQNFSYSGLENWKKYKHELLGLEFKYPPEFTLKPPPENSIGKDQITTLYFGDIILENLQDIYQPKIKIWVNPDGSGPYFPDKFLRLSEDTNGRISIKNIEDRKDPNSDDGMTEYIASYESKNGNYYWIHFLSKIEILKNSEEYFEMFKQFITTFRFF